MISAHRCPASAVATLENKLTTARYTGSDKLDLLQLFLKRCATTSP